MCSCTVLQQNRNQECARRHVRHTRLHARTCAIQNIRDFPCTPDMSCRVCLHLRNISQGSWTCLAWLYAGMCDSGKKPSKQRCRLSRYAATLTAMGLLAELKGRCLDTRAGTSWRARGTEKHVAAHETTTNTTLKPVHTCAVRRTETESKHYRHHRTMHLARTRSIDMSEL